MNIPAQSTPAGRIKMSHLGKSGLRSKRASTARIAALLSDTPFAYTDDVLIQLMPCYD
jgi:hypothetical protein